MNRALSSTGSNRSTRRKFIKETIIGVIALGFGGATRRTDPLNPGFSEYRYFSAHEAEIFQAIAERIIGKVPLDVDVVRRADLFLAEEDEEIREQIHQLLTVFNAPFFTFLFDLRFSSFITMSPGDQDSYLEDWMTSSLAFRRTGFQALKRLCVSMYYTDEQSWESIGYEGMFQPGERQ
jgi:hypothetical protein